MSNNLQVIEREIMALQPRFESLSVDSNIVFAREAEFALQIIGGNNYLQKIAMGNMQALHDSVLNVSSIGISLNPARKQAYLVPRKGKICLDISYMGLLDMAIAGGAIRWGQAEVVYEGDVFKRTGFNTPPIHECDPFDDGRTNLRGTYVVVKTADGDYLTHTMSAAKVFSIRDRSEAWKAYLADNSKKCPWVTDEEEMVKKTVIKQASKTWPKSAQLDRAIHHLNTEADEGIEFTPQQEPEQPVGRKPDVAMPEARKRPAPEGVTDVEPKQKPAQSNLCSEGERMFITRKLERKQWSVAYAREIAGLDVSETLDNLTADEFIALKDVLK